MYIIIIMINLTLNSMNNLMCNSQLLMTFGLRVTLQDYSNVYVSKYW